MALSSWKPGTSRWAYLLTGFYLLFLAVGLPMTIAQDQGRYWALFGLIMASGICTTAAAYLARRDVRRRAAPDPSAGTRPGFRA